MAISTQLAARSRNTSLGARGTLYITGWQAVAGAFANEASQIQRRVVNITDMAANRIETAQRANIPVDEGRTRASVENTAEVRGDDYARQIGPTWFVARYLQFGTIKMSAKMDLYAASRRDMDWWQDRMAEASTL